LFDLKGFENLGFHIGTQRYIHEIHQLGPLVDAYLFERTWAAMDDVGMLAT